jgi:translation elongation factor EF-Ts
MSIMRKCLMADAVDALERADADLLAALEGLRNRGVLTAEPAEEAKRRIAAGGAA